MGFEVEQEILVKESKIKQEKSVTKGRIREWIKTRRANRSSGI